MQNTLDQLKKNTLRKKKTHHTQRELFTDIHLNINNT